MIDAFEIITDLERIANTKYEKKDSNRNHQTFAKALLWIMRRLITH